MITKQYPVAAQKRLTLYANAIPELAGKDFSTTITRGRPASSPSGRCTGA